MVGFSLLGPVLKIALPVGALLMAPVIIANGKLQANEACADGTCCAEQFSICNIGAGDNQHYYKKACDGPCAQKCPNPT